ncbi:MAG: type II toxin-antitoxin system PemK/MazF family toxin [Bacilli bacterium]|nr:type II toxin-antitoxin system PemK/MazF family toxin [Bacilli bacterium]
MKQETKHLKLMKSYNNNVLISDMNLEDKFTEFENSKLNESETLLYEVKVKPTRFKRYSRGQIVKVKFGVNIGSEFSGDHYAIVISKQDTMLNPILHVIPLTSKKHNYNIELNNLLYNEDELNNLKELLSKDQDKNNIKKIKKCIKYYSNRKDKISYACIKHLKTVSKLSICKPINEFDYLNKVKISNDLLRKIDEEIVREYTLL